MIGGRTCSKPRVKGVRRKWRGKSSLRLLHTLRSNRKGPNQRQTIFLNNLNDQIHDRQRRSRNLRTSKFAGQPEKCTVRGTRSWLTNDFQRSEKKRDVSRLFTGNIPPHS